MVCWFSWCPPHYHLCTFVLLAHELIKTPPLSGGQREEEIIVESAMNVPAFCITLFELTISIPSSFLSFLFSATVSWSQPGRLTALQIVKKKMQLRWRIHQQPGWVQIVKNVKMWCSHTHKKCPTWIRKWKLCPHAEKCQTWIRKRVKMWTWNTMGTPIVFPQNIFWNPSRSFSKMVYKKIYKNNPSASQNCGN